MSALGSFVIFHGISGFSTVFCIQGILTVLTSTVHLEVVSEIHIILVVIFFVFVLQGILYSPSF